MYDKEEEIKPTKLVRITEREYKILKEQKKVQGISMAKIVCNLIIDKYK